MTLVNPSLDRAGRGGGRTAFERNILPEFASWVIEQIEVRRPDYLIPAETKGARVLEAVLRYAREELGTPILVPVLYGTALAYLDPVELADKRLMVVDDAVRTGTNLAYHRRRARAYGARDVEAIACIGAGDGKRRDVDCFLVVDQDLYREYVWQLTELVVARGLPPEVDHHIYELRLPRRLAGSWQELQDLLSRFGTVTLDGPAERAEALLGMTLHFPRLPGRESPEPQGFRAVDKLRFFPDLVHECAYVVPVVFPPLEVPAGGPLQRIDHKLGRELLGELASEGSLGDLLLAEAKTLNAKVLFRAGSNSAEAEAIIALGRALGGALPGISISAHPDSFTRLYGPRCGVRAASLLAARLTQAVDGGQPEAPGEQVFGEPLFLDREVIEATHEIVRHLRNLFLRAHAEGRDRSERVGLSVPGICRFLPDASPLLISRCLDYGMATTALVPFAGYEERAEGALIERRYRVSEPLRGEKLAYEDVGDARVELSEQAVAVIAHNVIERSSGTQATVESKLLAALVAVLRPLVLEGHSVPLDVVPGDDGPEILLLDDARRIGIDEKDSLFFSYDAVAGGYRPTPHFLELYQRGALPVEVRRSVEDLESRLEMVLPLLDSLGDEEREALMDGWTMSTDQRLGLTHVRHALDGALRRFAAVAHLVQRGAAHDHAGGVAASAIDAAARANRMLDVLESDWQQPAIDLWSENLALERRFLLSLASPRKPLEFYALPRRLAELVKVLGGFAERLSAMSAQQWAKPEEDVGAVEIAQSILAGALRVRRELNSLDRAPAEVPHLGARPPSAALGAAAEELGHAVKVMRALLAACAGAYRGPEEPQVHQPDELRRHAAVLSIDIVGSRAHAQSFPQTHDAWKNEGLNIAAQWARTFGGWEARSRFGDDLLLEFESADAAALCAALVQCHAAALCSTDLDAISRHFRAGLDCGQIVTQTGGSASGDCMDRVTFIAQECDPADATIDIYATGEAFQFCSAGLRDQTGALVAGWDKEVSLDKGETTITSVALESTGLLDLYCERIAELATELDAELAGGSATPAFELGPAADEPRPAVAGD